MTTGRINQVARLQREPARQLRHRPGRAGLRRTQTGNRCSYEREALRMHASTLRTLCSRSVVNYNTTRTRSACRHRQHDETAYRSNDSYKGPPEVCGAKSRRAIALGTASVRAGKNPSDSSKAFDHAPTQGFRQHFGCPNDKKMSEGQANNHRGTTSLPKRG
jgi:hypothetical protein